MPETAESSCPNFSFCSFHIEQNSEMIKNGERSKWHVISTNPSGRNSLIIKDTKRGLSDYLILIAYQHVWSYFMPRG